MYSIQVLLFRGSVGHVGLWAINGHSSLFWDHISAPSPARRCEEPLPDSSHGQNFP